MTRTERLALRAINKAGALRWRTGADGKKRMAPVVAMVDVIALVRAGYLRVTPDVPPMWYVTEAGAAALVRERPSLRKRIMGEG